MAELNVLDGHMQPVRSIAFSTDGTCIVSGSNDNSVWVWDASTGAGQNMLNGHMKPVWSVGFSTDGTCIISGSYDNSVQVYKGVLGLKRNICQSLCHVPNIVARRDNDLD